MGFAAIALVALSAFLMVGPLFLDAFECRSPIGPRSLALWPQPMWVRPVACTFGSPITFFDVGFVGLVVAAAWAVHAKRRGLAALALALAIAGAAWLFFALAGPDLVRRIVGHLARMS